MLIKCMGMPALVFIYALKILAKFPYKKKYFRLLKKEYFSEILLLEKWNIFYLWASIITTIFMIRFY